MFARAQQQQKVQKEALHKPALRTPFNIPPGLPNSVLLSLLENADAPIQPNKTGLPDAMKARFERLTGMSLDDVRVHRNSDKPAELGALAYAKGNEIHLGPGQEEHLEHELGHVVQQKQGLVKVTSSVCGMPVNEDLELERGAENDPFQKLSPISKESSYSTNTTGVIQCFKIYEPMPYIPPNQREKNKSESKLLWDSDWNDEDKQKKISELTSAQMDTIINQARGLIATTSDALTEIEKIIALYNGGNNSLPQSKTMEDAPSKLIFSSDSPIKDSMQQISTDKKFDIGCSEVLAKFLEDSIEGLRSGCIGTRVSTGSKVSDYILAGRKKRWGDKKHIPDTEVGARAADGKEARANAEKLTKKHVYLLCPIEGGNMLTGSDFVIIGKDSLYATMGLYNVDEAKAKVMIGRDFNIDASKVYPVEQPGEYHLDMAMTLVTNKTVLIKKPPDKEQLINETIKDLKSFNFDVIEDEGNATGEGYNFLNGEFVKAKDGKVYFLTNEPDSSAKNSGQAKEEFKKFMKSKFTDIEDVLFIKDALSLKDKGGLGCRVKGMPKTIR